ncbi:MAG: hypothetical protein Q7T16_01535 [Candidatus Burarchaeum sp.]|nr:hypothetical protein [Candidatus Burarchaeum sp.]MDO8339318.1 hypothetical protein [Candidatus Burarchaeum sp.]
MRKELAFVRIGGAGSTRKGFAFTLIFVLIASLLVLIAIDAMNWKQGEPTFAEVSKRAAIADDVAHDFVSLAGISFNASRNDSHVLLSFSGSMPSQLADADGAVAGYEKFVEEDYAKLANSKIKINAVRPAIRFTAPEFTYAYVGWNEKEVALAGKADAYYLKVRLDKACGAGCIAEGAWNWTDAGTFVSLDLRDAEGGSIAPPGGKASGYVNAQQYNYFTAMLADNSTPFSLSLSGNELRMSPGSAHAAVDARVAISHAGAVKAEVPLEIEVDGTQFNGVPVLEK